MKELLLIIMLLTTSAYGQSAEQRFEGGGFATYSFLREIGTRDAGVGSEIAGLGGRVVYHALPHVDIEGDLAFLPGNSATIGNILQGQFGAKAGWRFKRLGLFAKARPGFIHFRRDPFGVPAPGSGLISHERAHSTEPSLDLGAVIEYYTAKGLILRVDGGSTFISYDDRLVRVSQFLPDIKAGGFTAGNAQVSVGVGFRF